MMCRREAVLALRRGGAGALASGGARMKRACAAVRKGAQAEAGWCRAPRARAEGFMGVRLRTWWGDRRGVGTLSGRIRDARHRFGARRSSVLAAARQVPRIRSRVPNFFLSDPAGPTQVYDRCKIRVVTGKFPFV